MPLPCTYFDYSSGANNCVIFSLDRDNLNVANIEEWVGFRHNANAIEMKISGDAADNDCLDGDGVTWVALTDTDVVNVTAFNLDPTPSYELLVQQDTATQSFLEVRKVDISITGQLASGGPSTSKTITETIRLRNDRFYTQVIIP